MKAPVSKGLPFIGHSIEFKNDALALTNRLREKHGDVLEISILNERVTMFSSPSATTVSYTHLTLPTIYSV